MSTAVTRVRPGAHGQALRRGLRVLKLMAVGVLGGLIAGMIAGGIGSRVAMRIVTLAGGSSIQGQLSDNGNVIGEITLGGTIFLLLLGGIFAGVPGGLLYVVVRRWIPGSGLRKGLAYGTFLLLAFGAWPPTLFFTGPVISAENPDFSLLVSPYLSIGLFAALFVLYGLILVPLVELLDPTPAGPPRLRPVKLAGYAVLADLCLYGLTRNVEAMTRIIELAELYQGG